MREILLAIFFTLVIQFMGCKVTAQNEIFRHVTLNDPYGTIQLGDPMGELLNIVELKDSLYYLKHHTFAFASSIQLRFDKDKALTGMVFSYPKGWEIEKAISEYRAMLGDPVLEDGKWIWNDGKTQFQIDTTNHNKHASLIDL